MSERISLQVSLKLNSDAIFGSGFSVPGGEDIAVKKNEDGFPYLSGSTFKGLLRESLENWLSWTGGSEKDLTELLGKEDREGNAENRRITVTSLKLTEKPELAEDCFSERTFTALENGVVKTDTLRVASCIRRGLRFTGEVSCSAEDERLVTDALRAIKWVGTLRNRGFGSVTVTAVRGEKSNMGFSLGACSCIHYSLVTEEPLIITNLAASAGYDYAARDYITGAAVRGMVMGKLASESRTLFEEKKAELLGEGVRFYNALPSYGGSFAIPTIKGFYADKDENKTEIRSVLRGEDIEGMKRARLGSFCAIENEKIKGWSTKTGSATRILRNTDDDKQMFKTSNIAAGQRFEGYITLDNPDLAPEIAKCFADEIWLGADRYAGFGKCHVEELTAVSEPKWVNAYAEKAPTATIYILALSPLCMTNEYNQPCGLDEKALALLLGVEQVLDVECCTSTVEIGGYNRTWGCRVPSVNMYDSGSLFKLKLSSAPDIEKLRKIEASGLGVRRSEGCGQVLFLNAKLYDAVRSRADTSNKKAVSGAESKMAKIRRARYQWLMDNVDKLSKGGKYELSKSQRGTLQTILESEIRTSGNETKELDEWFEHNINDRGARHGERFKAIRGFTADVLGTPLSETLKLSEGTIAADGKTERLKLLCELIDYNRKVGEQK